MAAILEADGIIVFKNALSEYVLFVVWLAESFSLAFAWIGAAIVETSTEAPIKAKPFFICSVEERILSCMFFACLMVCNCFLEIFK